MVTENTVARAGVANGTQATFEGVMLKFGKTSSKTAVDGIEIDSVFASDISHMVLKHSSGSQKNNTFQMVPKKCTLDNGNEISRNTKQRLRKLKQTFNSHKKTAVSVENAGCHDDSRARGGSSFPFDKVQDWLDHGLTASRVCPFVADFCRG
jgi:hypothetical protein